MMHLLDTLFGVFVIAFMAACVLVPLALGVRSLIRRKFVWAATWMVIATLGFVGNPVIRTLVFDKFDLGRVTVAVRSLKG
jgi:hypothetical protein